MRLSIPKKIFALILLAIDLTIFIAIFPVYCVVVFIYFNIFRNAGLCQGQRNALFLPSSGSVDDVVNKFGNLDILREHNPGDFFNQVHICFFPTKKNNSRKLNDSIFIYDFKMAPLLKFMSVFLYTHGLIKIIKANRISIVRSFSPYTVGFIGRIISYVFGIPFCVSIHEDYDKRYQLLKKNGERIIFGSRLLARITERFVYRTSDMILPIRASLKETIIKLGIDKNKICIIPHGVNLTFFNLSDTDREFFAKINPNAKKLIVSVCRHSMDNYILDIVEAAKLLSQKRNDFLFIMIGDGVIHDEVKRKICAYRLSDFVKAPGFVSRDKVIKYWLACDIAICLMGGYSLIEAALAGKPIISYDVEWHHELVINEETGFLLKERDIEAVVASLNALLSNHLIAREYGMNIKRIAEEKHSLAVSDQIKIACYKRLMKVG